MKIFIVSSIDHSAIKQLQMQHDVIYEGQATTKSLHNLISDREILIFRSGVSITVEAMKRAPNLKYLIRAGSGIDNLDVEYVRRRGLKLYRIPGPGAQAVAEMTFALLLSLSRNLLAADRSMRQGRWEKYELIGYLLSGKTLGIIGLGNIGTRVAELGLSLGMKVIGCVESPNLERSSHFYKQNISLMEIDEVVSTSDYLSINVPLKESTRHMINNNVLALTKPGAFLVNLSRGGVVDEVALFKELSEGNKLRGAALDVHEREGEGNISPLIGLSNVILTPHIGAMTVDSQRQIGQKIVEIVDSLETDPTKNLDELPVDKKVAVI